MDVRVGTERGRLVQESVSDVLLYHLVGEQQDQ